MGKSKFVRNRRTPAGSYGGVKGLLQWIRREHPSAYASMVRERPQLLRAADGLDGLGAAGATASLVDKANQIAASVLPFLQLSAQRKLLNAQVARAKQGLPPLDISQVQLPATRVEVDAGTNVASIGRWVGIGALGLVAFLALRAGLRAQR